mmetsp:Transcript_107787/g.303706  ORF Transcript_107787/g.303706 Transcript_107787/m.303706 type:complete len:417 (-) Transcript_107787:22-1272(-)
MASIEVNVHGLADRLCTVVVHPATTVLQMKQAVEIQTGIAAIEQHLLLGATGLRDDEFASELPFESDSADVTLLRRRPEQVEWLRQIRQAWGVPAPVLKFLPDDARADRVVALEAVTRYAADIEHVAAELRADRELVLTAARQDASTLMLAPAELFADREVFLMGVRWNGLQLSDAAPHLRADRDVVLAALRCNGWDLMHVSDELLEDDEVLDAAVDSGFRLSRAPEWLRSRGRVALAAARHDGSELLHAAPELRSDPDFGLAVVSHDGSHLKYLSPVLHGTHALQRAGGTQDEPSRCAGGGPAQRPRVGVRCSGAPGRLPGRSRSGAELRRGIAARGFSASRRPQGCPARGASEPRRMGARGGTLVERRGGDAHRRRLQLSSGERRGAAQNCSLRHLRGAGVYSRDQNPELATHS